jgi:myo-inositol-1(or 4)-monophosphatase
MEQDHFNNLKIAKYAARKAGKALLEKRVSFSKIDSASRRDVKIEGDVAAEGIILSHLKKKSPYPFLSEEFGMSPLKENNQYKWIVDPLDGTVNYSRGIPFSNISIGLFHGETPILGVVYDFNRDELFSGIVGKGAWLNEKKISVSNIKKTDDAILCTGFPVKSDFSKESINDFIENVQHYKKVRFFGAAALSICYVACGRTDAYSENNIMLWDVAAGCAIVLSAGGFVNMKIDDISSPIYFSAKCCESI